MHKNQKDIVLSDLKNLAKTLQSIYLNQSNQYSNNNCYHENSHDNSPGHPDYHNNSHDNTPGRMMKHALIKNVTN